MMKLTNTKLRMDTITKSYFDDFSEKFEYQNLSEDERFERFVAYSIVSKHYTSDTLDKTLLEEVCLGGGNDWGIDTFAIIVNNRLISCYEEIDYCLTSNNYLDVQFVFIQSKNKTAFKVGEMANFLNGILDVFSTIDDAKKVYPPSNETLKKYLDLVKMIYENASKFKDDKRPRIVCYYVTTGRFNEDNKDIEARVESFMNQLERMQLFTLSEKMPYMYGAQDLTTAYNSTYKSVDAEITVGNSIVMPEIEGVKEGYLFLLPFKEYKKIIMNSDNTLKNVFNDNIRAFQGDNVVNIAIQDTLRDGNFALFTAMNNGVTIIAKDMQSVGSKFIIRDYQIVNGCQTTNVLYNNRKLSGIEDLQITVKLIASQQDSIRDRIVLGTNSQTAISKEQLLSLSKIQKRIEEYYKAKECFHLFYERRSKQYLFDRNVPTSKIITISVQITSFVSMIMGEPHRVNGYYGDIINFYRKMDKDIFSEDYVVDLYYTSGLAYYKLMKLFADGKIPKRYKSIKQHVLYAFRLQNEACQLQDLTTDRKVIPYCDSLNTILCNDELCFDGFLKAVKLIDKVSKHFSQKDLHQLEAFTKALRKASVENNNY